MKKKDAFAALFAALVGTYRMEGAARICLVCHANQYERSTGHTTECPVGAAFLKAESMLRALAVDAKAPEPASKFHDLMKRMDVAMLELGGHALDRGTLSAFEEVVQEIERVAFS